MLRHLAIAGLVVLLLTGAPLTDEDVVRLYVGGASVAELIATIEDSAVDFDLSEDMQDELRLAGIPDAVLAAMRQRQLQFAPAPAAAEPAAGRLVVRLNPDRDPDKARPVLQMLDAVEPKLAEALELRGPDMPVTDIGVALFCRTPDHVPDQWRSKSPLGRDFRVARHRMLAYASGASSEPAAKWRDRVGKLGMARAWRESMADLHVLTFEVPEQLEADLQPGTAHDLSLGIVIRVGQKYYLASYDEYDGVLLEESGETTMLADLRGQTKDPFKARVEFYDLRESE